jgi:hypothetical protein
VPSLPPNVRNCALIPHFQIAFRQGTLKPGFLGLIKKAHLASAINAGLIHTSHGVFCQLTGFHCASEHAG